MVPIDRRRIRRYLRGGDTAATAAEKGKALEDLIGYLIAQIPGITHTSRNQRNLFGTEEIDVAFWNDHHPDGLCAADFPSIILVECKNWSKRVGSEEISWFITKLRNRGMAFGIFVAANGITGESKDLTDSHIIVSKALAEGIRMIVITRSEIEGFTNTDQIVKSFKVKLCQLVVNETCLIW